MGRCFLLAGGFDEQSETIKQKQMDLTRAIVSEIIAQRHKLVMACMNDFDAFVAKCANDAAKEHGH